MKNLFPENRFFYALTTVCVFYLLGYFFPVIGVLADIGLIAFLVLAAADAVLLSSHSEGITLSRRLPQRFSNGDENTVKITVNNHYSFPVSLRLIDETPIQFQLRDFLIKTVLAPGESKTLSYTLRPVQRGEFGFGCVNTYAVTALKLFKRRFRSNGESTIPVYPSFIQMRKFELYAMTSRLSDIGIKKVRRVGHTMEFDRIKEYVIGDDVRSINWKATSRARQLMVNQYRDERSQQIVSVIDTGRVMKMPFNGLQLLEYAINTGLVISNIALLKEDRAGLITFSNQKFAIVKPDNRRTHIRKIQEALYNLETNFLESNYEDLVLKLRRHLSQRSLILLYTNFETFSSMERQLPYLQTIAKDHLLVVIFFENTELAKLLSRESNTVNEIYTKVAAEKFFYEKRRIVKTLNRYGIHSILTAPEELSVRTINKYLELKARGLI